jgi:hypothetical protein
VTGRVVRLAAVGHEAVTGRHDKTLELTAEDAITARATCVLGVAAGPMPGELPLLRGTVRLTLTAGGRTAEVTGEVNPGYAAPGRLVVRRSDQPDADTFLLNASGAAADLPPDLLVAMARAGEPVTVTATEIGTPPPVVLVLLPGPAAPPVARLAAQADLVLDLTGRGSAPPSVPLKAPRRHGGAVPGGHRTVVVLAESADEVPPVPAGARVLVWPPDPGADLLLAAGLPAAPTLRAGALPGTSAGRRELVRALAAAPAPVVLTVPTALLPGRSPVDGPTRPRGRSRAAASDGGIEELWSALPGWTVLVPDPAVGWGVGAAGPQAGLSGLRRAPYLVLVPPERTTVPVDPAELARLLRTAGVSGRDTTAALTALGLPRKEAYRLSTDHP